jgi:DNA-binding transcriptional MerR regulator
MAKEKYIRTSQIAADVGCHPNTVRLYEAWGYIPKAPRSASNYRLFTEKHLDHMRLAWHTLSGSYPGKAIKQSALRVIKHAAATGDLGGALELAYSHLVVVRSEKAEADAAAALLARWSQGGATDATAGRLRIGEAADLLDVSRDMLRNWESNGVIKVPRGSNGYRQYGPVEIGRLRVIRMLVRAGYSMMAILRMLRHLDEGSKGDVRTVLDTPNEGEEVLTAADQWLSNLEIQEEKCQAMIAQLEKMIERGNS